MSGREPDPGLADALASVSPFERALWGWSIRKNLSKRGTRLARMIPKYGVVAATQSVVGNMWLGPAIIGMFVGIPLAEGSSGASQDLGYAFLALLVVCLLMAAFRIATSFRAGRQYRAGADQ